MNLWVPLLWLLQTATMAVSSSPETCQSLACTTLAADMASKMNLTADPCEDFYNFACGNFPSISHYNPRTVRPRDRVGQKLIVHSLSLMTEKIERKLFEMLVLPDLAVDRDPSIQQLYHLTRLFFLSCTEFLRYNSASMADAFINGTFNHLMQSLERGNQTLEGIMAALVRTGGGPVINLKLPESFLYEAFQEDLTNTSRAVISVFCKHSSSKNAIWFGRFVDYLRSKGIARGLNLFNTSETFDTIINIYANASDRFREPRLDQYTIAELDASSELDQPGNSFSWSLFFEELLESPVNSSAKVDVWDVDRVTYILNYFKRQPVYSITSSVFSDHVSFLILDWLISYGEFLPPHLRCDWNEFANLTHRYDQFLLKPTGGRVEECMLLTKSYLQPIVERMYQSTYHPNTFKGVRDLVHLIKRASAESVRRQSWITKSGQDSIIEKINWVKHSIGFDALKRNQLKEMYNKTLYTFGASNETLSGSADSFGSLMSIALSASCQRHFVLMSGRKSASAYLGMSALVVNAFNNIEKNRIVFPMAILEPPVYHPDYPDYIKLGNLGYIIGHEIGHSFDNIGHTLNRQGVLGHFWDNDTETAYLDRVECVRASYSNYTLYPGGPTTNSNSTLGNDIADILGIQAAYNALQLLKQSSGSNKMSNLPTNISTRLNQEQLFFVQAAQSWCTRAEPNTLAKLFGGPRATHSAGHLRIRGMIENSWEFARIFSCKRGQGMHPNREKCAFW